MSINRLNRFAHPKGATHFLLAILILLSLACGMTTPTPDLKEDEEPTPTASLTATSTRTPTPTATRTPTTTPTYTPTPLVCVKLLTPEDGIELPTVGKVNFSWTPLDGANQYLLNIIMPSGNTVIFETNGMTRDRYMEAFPQGGEYQWNVTALATDESQICSSDFFSFTKPQTPGRGSGGGNGAGTCPNGAPQDPVTGNCPPIIPTGQSDG